MKKILGLVRASTEEQEIETQRVELEKYICGLGYKPEEIIFLAVKGASAVKQNSKYQRLIEDMKNTILSEKLEAVAIYHINRLGRNDVTLMTLKAWMTEHKIQLFCREPDFKLLDPHTLEPTTASTYMFAILSAQVVADTKEQKDKTQRGTNRNISNNLFYGGTLPLGYTYDRKTLVITQDDDDAALVRWIFSTYVNSSGGTYELAEQITARGHKMSQQGIIRLLRNTTYITGQWKKLTLPTLIEKELFEAAQDKINSRRQTKSKKHYYIAARLIRCPHCGSYLVNTERYYECSHHKHPHFRSTALFCQIGYTVPSWADEAIWEATKAFYRQQYTRGYESTMQDNMEKAKILEEQVPYKEEQLNGINERISRAEDLYITMGKTKEWLLSKIKDIEADKVRLTAEIRQMKTDIKRLRTTVTDNAEEIKRYVESQFELSDKEKYELAHSWIKDITPSRPAPKTTVLTVETYIGLNITITMDHRNKTWHMQ